MKHFRRKAATLGPIIHLKMKQVRWKYAILKLILYLKLKHFPRHQRRWGFFSFSIWKSNISTVPTRVRTVPTRVGTVFSIDFSIEFQMKSIDNEWKAIAAILRLVLYLKMQHFRRKAATLRRILYLKMKHFRWKNTRPYLQLFFQLNFKWNHLNVPTRVRTTNFEKYQNSLKYENMQFSDFCFTKNMKKTLIFVLL